MNGGRSIAGVICPNCEYDHAAIDDIDPTTGVYTVACLWCDCPFTVTVPV